MYSGTEWFWSRASCSLNGLVQGSWFHKTVNLEMPLFLFQHFLQKYKHKNMAIYGNENAIPDLLSVVNVVID